MGSSAEPSDGFKALTGAFLARFFESDITANTDDLKGSFFWLLAALAMPGLFIPWLMVFDWNLIGMIHGPIALREASRAEKAFYLGFAMIASGLLTTITWSSLLPDRRDTLILGALPVTPKTIVQAKLAALGGYILLVAVSMHAMAAFFFGSILATNSGGIFAVRGMLAHFAASCAASAAVALSVSAAQGLALAVAGPRLFTRVSTALQVLVVGVIATALASLPSMTSAVVHTLRGWGQNSETWILSTPPMWFLGLYEWILGTTDPLLIDLAQKAGWMLLLTTAVTVVTYPIAYRRLMVSVAEIGDAAGRNSIGRALRAVLVRAAGRHQEVRAAADFYAATISRVERHRFVLAMAMGLAIAWSIPGSRSNAGSSEPGAALLSLPLACMIFLLVGLRLAASLPGDVRAGWLFDVHQPSRAHARQALERMMVALGVLPPVLLSAPVYWWLWGGTVAIVHSAIGLALGGALVQRLIWDCDSIPCGQRWAPGRGNLGRRWPLYLGVFLLIAVGVPRLELLLFQDLYAAAGFVLLLLILVFAARYASARHVIVPSYDDVDPVAGVLRLN